MVGLVTKHFLVEVIHYLERTYINIKPRPKATKPMIKKAIAKTETIATTRTGRYQFKNVPETIAQKVIQMHKEG